MRVTLKFFWLLYFLVSSCILSINLLHSQDFPKKVKVIRTLSFGNITYQGLNPIFTVANNSLQSLDGDVKYTASGVHLGEVEIYGEANETVNLTFYNNQTTDANMGAYITNITTNGLSNTIKLDNTGKARFEITATIKLNERAFNNNLVGNIRMVFNYIKDNTVITEDLPWTVKALGFEVKVISQLNFGKLIPRSDKECTVTIYSDGNTPTSDCVGLSGAGATPLVINFNNFLLSLIDFLFVTIPESNVDLSSKDGKVVTISNFSYTKKEHFGADFWNNSGTLTVGATLHIPANFSGEFSGSFDVTWLFNQK